MQFKQIFRYGYEKLIYNTVFSFGFFLLLFSCNPQLQAPNVKQTQQEKLIKKINLLIDDPNLAAAHIGVYIEALKDRSLIYRHEAAKLFIPASNLKLYTTACALELLGPDYRFRTEFYIKGSVKDSVLIGDLIVRGMGDPSISGRYRDGDKQAYFKDWADSLRHYGINQIDGQIIADDGFFNDNVLADGWNWDDEPFWYSAQISALSYNDNCIDVTIAAGMHAGDSLLIVADPLAKYVATEIDAISCTADFQSSLKLSRNRGKNELVMKGRYPIGSAEYKESITIENPPLWFAENMHHVFMLSGLTVGRMPTVRKNAFRQAGVSLLFVQHSLPLSDLIITLNKKSHNFYADQLFKTLGAEILNDGSWNGGMRVVRGWLDKIWVVPAYTDFIDGSGLSRKDLVAPLATAAVLRNLYYSKNFPYYYNSLPVAGVDGTLKKRLKNTSAAGVVHAKTGYIGHVRSLSGYTHDKAGNDYIFVIMVNNYLVPTSFVNDLQDQIVLLLTTYMP